MNYPKLKDLHKKSFTIKSLYEPRWEMYNKATNKMEFKDEVTEADKTNGFRLKVGAVVEIDGSEDNTLNLSFSQLKNIMAALDVTDKTQLIDKSVTVIWNKMEGLDSRYSFIDVE